MKMFAIALLFVTAAASADDITIHFPDAFIIARDCPHMTYTTWVEGQRHFGKIGVNAGCDVMEGVQRPGAFPMLPPDDMNVQVLFDGVWYFNCAMINTRVMSGESELVVQCLEEDLIFRTISAP